MMLPKNYQIDGMNIEDWIDKASKIIDELKATADRRLELLRNAEKALSFCPECRGLMKPHLAEFASARIGHQPDCALARELGIQQSDNDYHGEGVA